jgi:L-asparagine transporter-like permease
MWPYPYLTILTIVLFAAVIASVGIIAETRIQLALSLPSAGLVFGANFVFRRGRSGGGSGPDATRTADARAGSAER